MKRFFLYISLILCFLGCNHKDLLWMEVVEDLDGRITYLEQICSEMNTNIAALQTIVDVLQSNDYITGIVEIKRDGVVIGYTITFGKHDPITIYHGQDGKDGQDGTDGQDGINGTDGKDGADGSTPIIGVAQDTDGVYYWTLNGEWLLDDNGNKLPVSGTNGKDGQNGSNGQDGTDGKDGQDGADGKDGVTPQLKIEDGYWYISYDNGATWTQLGKATGEDGKDGQDGSNGTDGKDGKDGQDGDSMFQSVTQDENYVYFTLADGTVIIIPKNSNKDYLFSVSSSKKVVFSEGNLQYNPKNKEWRIAENQWDCIGDKNRNISDNYDGWIDLFGWGTGNKPTEYATTNSEYRTFADWGTVWRSLTSPEWDYIIESRYNANLLNGVARVNGICGLIILPDDWICPAGCNFSPGFGNYDNQTYTISEWGILEDAGAVFLPAAGNRYGASVNNVQTWGFYWSSTAYDTYSSARCLEFTSSQAKVDRESYCYGLSVRLVKVVQ